MREGALEDSLVNVLGDAGGKDLVEDAAEFALDAVLEEGFLKDVPVIGTVAKLYSICVGAQGYVFAKKMRRFMTALASIPRAERDEFANRLRSDDKLQKDVSETLITLLDKIDDSQKAPLLANAFAGFIREEFDFSTFRRLGAALDRCLVSDLSVLDQLEKPRELDSYVGDVLVGAGLASLTAIPTIRAADSRPTYLISELGKLFRQVVIKGLTRNDE